MVSTREYARRLRSAADRHPWFEIGLRVVRRDLEVGGTLLAGALAFRLFIWLLPGCLLVAAVLGFTASSGHPVEELTGKIRLSPLAANVVGQVGAQAERGRYLTALIGLVLLCVAGLALGRALDGIHARIWQVRVRGGVRPTLSRAARYTAVLLGVVVVNVAGPVVGVATGAPLATAVVPSLVIYLALATILLSVEWPPHWRRALPGAAVIALGIEVLHLAAVLYLPGRLDRASQLYGALGVAAALLVWLALVTRLVVVGQVLNAVLAERRPARSISAG